MENRAAGTTATRPVQAQAGVSGAVLLVLALVSGIGPLATDMYLPTFPDLAEDLHVSAAAVQMSLTTYMVGFGVGQYVIGAVSDRTGRRGLLVGGTALAAAASIAAALAPTIEVFLATRVLQGLGAAVGVVLARAVVSDCATGTRLARQLSLMMVIQGVAPIAAPLLGSVLAGLIGWRGIMGVLAACSAVLLVVLVRVVPETLQEDLRATAPVRQLLVSPLRVLGIGRFALPVVGITGGFGALFAYISASPFILQNVFGLGTLAYGLVFAFNAVVVSAASAVNARLMARIPVPRLLRGGVVLLVAGSAGALVDVLLAPNLVVFVLLVAVATIGFAFVLPHLTAQALGALPAERQGSGSAVIGTGQALSAGVVAPLVGLAGSDNALPTTVVMVVCSLVVVFAVALASRLRPA